ncbi:Repeat domain in Vibrio, Colwellia, Bradyrhizobium and Shewanella [Candidatus Tiddalikarchaeum anstoanum]|nr:Repeat domain in Vibrio, Colwellia, Bradyrhizobium and Shewanella [Candidatus Tiddalikarchaeum anstoanum]
MRKAITPIIATILLILITIITASAAFVWISSVQTSLEESAGGAILGSLGGCSRVSLISMRGDRVIVQNTGCDDISNITLLIDNILTSYDLSAPLSPGNSAIISFSNLLVGEDHCVKVLLSNGGESQLCSSASRNTLDAGYGYGCLNSSECGSGESCCSHVCFNPCNNDTECGIGFTCINPGGCNAQCQAISECTNNSECNDSNPCTNNICSTGSCTYPALTPNGQYTGCNSINYACMSGTCTNTCGDATCQSWENVSICLSDCGSNCLETQGSCTGKGVWFTGGVNSINNNYCACCGDDALNDIFYNATTSCSYGGIIYDSDSIAIQDKYGNNINHSSGSGVCELKNNTWMTSNGSFTLTKNYIVGLWPQDLAVGDFNKDGFLDYVFSDSAGNISVLLNDGSGDFGVEANYTANTTPWSVEVGDVNKDSNLDIVVTDLVGNYVTVFLNDGSGHFTKEGDFSTGQMPWDVSAGDFNRDSWLELAVANFNESKISILTNGHDGTFTLSDNYMVNEYPYTISTEDFNNDGWPDLAVTSATSNYVSVLLNYGNGIFAPKIDYFSGNTSNQVGGADFNNDGWPDLAVDYYNDIENFASVNVLFNNQDGSFTSNANYSVGIYPEGISVGDYNNDNWLDIIIASYNESIISVLMNNQDGTFNLNANYTVGTNPWDTIIGDFNNKGGLDILVLNNNNTVSLISNIGISGTGGPCCEVGDTFNNATHSCCNGVFKSGSC